MPQADNIMVSFVIPAYNEQDDIGETLQAIEAGDWPVAHEIIVVDNDSTDETSAIARQNGAKVAVQQGGTISSVRNTGVMNSQGDIIVFIDADVSLTSKWFDKIGVWLERLSEDDSLITGSICSVPADGNWLERYWFGSFTGDAIHTHLGTGHMILTRAMFERAGGFDTSLATGEDFEFCQRAIKAGGKLQIDDELVVVHRDFPANSWQFIRREAWHGTGDSKSLATLLASKVSLLSIVFLCMHVVLVAALLSEAVPQQLAILMVAGIVGLVVLSAFSKFRQHGLVTVLINSYVYYLYFIGRSTSLFVHDARK